MQQGDVHSLTELFSLIVEGLPGPEELNYQYACNSNQSKRNDAIQLVYSHTTLDSVL